MWTIKPEEEKRIDQGKGELDGVGVGVDLSLRKIDSKWEFTYLLPFPYPLERVAVNPDLPHRRQFDGFRTHFVGHVSPPSDCHHCMWCPQLRFERVEGRSGQVPGRLVQGNYASPSRSPRYRFENGCYCFGYWASNLVQYHSPKYFCCWTPISDHGHRSGLCERDWIPPCRTSTVIWTGCWTECHSVAQGQSPQRWCWKLSYFWIWVSWCRCRGFELGQEGLVSCVSVRAVCTCVSCQMLPLWCKPVEWTPREQRLLSRPSESPAKWFVSWFCAVQFRSRSSVLSASSYFTHFMMSFPLLLLFFLGSFFEPSSFPVAGDSQEGGKWNAS